MKKKEFVLDKKHVDYFNSIIPELVEAEETVTRIKSSKEFKRAYDYFSLLKHRGILKTRPTKENGYKWESADDVILTYDVYNYVIFAYGYKIYSNDKNVIAEIFNDYFNNKSRTINWFRFKSYDVFYDNDCNEYNAIVNHEQHTVELILKE